MRLCYACNLKKLRLSVSISFHAPSRQTQRNSASSIFRQPQDSITNTTKQHNTTQHDIEAPFMLPPFHFTAAIHGWNSLCMDKGMRRVICRLPTNTMYHHMQSLLPLLLLSLLRVHAYDVAKCYWAKTQQLPSNSDSSNSYIPCGDVSDGAQSCCRVGHNCLEANACYAPEGQSCHKLSLHSSPC